jgi:glyoxylase-like metal-dependent hydrolase (beta-lactamase superfamily II)
MLEITSFEEITQIRMSREIGGKPLFWVAAYLVDGLLIDTGCSYTAEELVTYLEKNPPKAVINTHYHEDHIGANRLIQDHFGINIYAHQDAIPLIGGQATLFPYQEMVWGYPEPSTVLPIPPIFRTDRFSFNVLETPGHSKDHLALLERSRGWCFSGDIFVNKTIRTIRPEEDMAATADSLRRLSRLQTERLVLLTALGRVFENGREVLESFDLFLEEISRKALKLQTEGRSVQEIITDLFGGEDPRAPSTNGQFTTENLIRSVLEMRDEAYR